MRAVSRSPKKDRVKADAVPSFNMTRMCARGIFTGWGIFTGLFT